MLDQQKVFLLRHARRIIDWDHVMSFLRFSVKLFGRSRMKREKKIIKICRGLETSRLISALNK